MPPGAVGEVWLRAPNVMAGYFNRPEETAAALTEDGWLRTGDGGFVDADGYLFLTDRIKDMVVSGGENVYPIEVEEALSQHPGVSEVAVIGLPDERWGETVTAIVVPVAGSEPTAEELIAFARSRLAGYKLPRIVEFAAELPRTPSGKVLKRDLRERYARAPRVAAHARALRAARGRRIPRSPRNRVTARSASGMIGGVVMRGAFQLEVLGARIAAASARPLRGRDEEVFGALQHERRDCDLAERCRVGALVGSSSSSGRRSASAMSSPIRSAAVRRVASA